MKTSEAYNSLLYKKILDEEFSNTYRRCKGKIERKAFYLTGSKQQTEDIVQEIFLKLWLKWPVLSIMPEDNLEDYIYAMVRNHVLNIQKKEKRLRKKWTDYREVKSNHYLPDEMVLAEGLKIYNEAIDQLTTKEKEVFLLYDSDLGRLAIAAKMKRSKNTINNQLNSAFRTVRSYLSKKLDLAICSDKRRKCLRAAVQAN
ncbi:RNA polymerase sigma factor [Niastella populi]|nr:sigma-70 family RNA polymerase sigma factor [Niastella populi]